MEGCKSYSKEYLYELTLKSTLQTNGEIYYVDLDKDYYQMIYPDYENKRESGCYSNAIKKYFDVGTIIEENGKPVRDFFSITNLKRNLLHKDKIQYTYRRINENGEEEWSLVSFVVCQRINGAVHGVTMQTIGIGDIMKRNRQENIRLEEALKRTKEADRAKTHFLSSMSHDMRTPLNVIVGMCIIAGIYEDNPEKVHDCLQKIAMSSKLLLTLVNEVLDMAKIENGEIDLTDKEFSITDMMREVILMAQAMISSKNQHLVFNLKNSKHKWVIGDETRIKQILLNIISNSVKYSEAESTITIDIEESPGAAKDSGNYKISITDQGKGMSKEFIEKLFEPFTREEQDRQVEGTGLGMAIVKNIVEAMNGKIEVESELGRGSRFVVILPLRFGSAKESADDELAVAYNDFTEDYGNSVPDFELVGYGVLEPAGSVKKDEEIRKNIHVLLAEDNVMNAQISAELLSCMGIETTIAIDGYEACNIFENSQVGEYDCIFMDIQMPRCNGFEATRSIRQMARPDRDIPIFAMTANAFTSDIERTKAAGMQEHIAKPFELNDILGVLKKWFPKRMQE